MIAQVAVSAAVYAIDKPYSYRIPPALTVEPGMRVSLPFGQGNRLCEGVVLAVEAGDEEGLKAISAVLDSAPVLSQPFLHLAAFLRERYFCTFYDAAKAMLPAGLWFQVREELTLDAVPAEVQFPKTHSRAGEILSALEAAGGRMAMAELKRTVDPAVVERFLPYLQKKGYLHTNISYARQVRDRVEQTAQLAVSWEEAMAYAASKGRSAPLQKEILTLLSQLDSVSVKELCYFTGASMATVRRLEQLGYLRLDLRPVLPEPPAAPAATAPPPVLNAQQQAAFDGLSRQMQAEKPGASLLYGVTGSGKTAVYLRLIAAALEQGRSAIYLVPEIALTPQLVSRLMDHFGATVAVLHSGLRVSERYDAWLRIRRGEARVVVGTRSAVFAPVENLGIVILDEEQEHSYKSENTPRYHAREVALYRGAREGALVLLGSATPSLETMFLARQGRITCHQLTERFNGGALPQVELVDMKEELRRGNNTSISLPLQMALEDAMAQGRQSILLLNRRGAGQYRVCVQCGQVPTCPRCSVSLTYHAVHRRMLCHYCGHAQPVLERCPVCGGAMKTMGTGTQKVEAELRELFPGKEILRMDADTVAEARSHEALLNRFRREEIPVLVGTQMVAKGLDFENVTLVGVVDADLSLYVSHYRAAETTFSMLTQVVGRAGRGRYPGRAIIQTMTPQHTVLTLAARQDYDQFYQLELSIRQLHGLPPFRDLYTMTFVSWMESRAVSGAARFRAMAEAEAAARQIPLEVLGPSPAPVVKVNNAYRYRLSLYTAGTRPVRRLLASLLKTFLQDKANRGVSAYLDINSYE